MNEPKAQRNNDQDRPEIGYDQGCVITMTDMDTQEDFSFVLVDDFAYDGAHYCVLVTADESVEPEMVITRVVTLEDGSEGLMSLDDDEFERVFEAYDRLCEEEDDDEEAHEAGP